MAEVKRQQPQVSSTSYSGFFFAPQSGFKCLCGWISTFHSTPIFAYVFLVESPASFSTKQVCHNQIKFQSHASTSITICNFRRHFSLLYLKNPTISTTFHFFIRFKQLWRVSVYYQTIPRLFRKAPIATSPQTDFRGFVFKLNRWHSFSWQPLLQMKCSKKSS